MKKIPRTILTWFFGNLNAPNQVHYMLTKLAADAKVVRVVAKQFRGKAELVIDFEINRVDVFEFSRQINDLIVDFASAFQCSALKHEVSYGGNAVSVRMPIDLINRVGFIETAMVIFMNFVKIVADRNKPYRYDLPYPTVIQEDMVEEYASDNWIPIGEYLWERFLAQQEQAEIDADIQREREGRVRAAEYMESMNRLYNPDLRDD